MAWSKLPLFPTCKGLHYRQLLETSGAKGHLKCEHSRPPKQGNEMSLVIKKNKTKQNTNPPIRAWIVPSNSGRLMDPSGIWPP